MKTERGTLKREPDQRDARIEGFENVDDLADRLGIAAADEKSEVPRVLIVGLSGRQYNVVALIQAVLDRLEAA